MLIGLCICIGGYRWRYVLDSLAYYCLDDGGGSANWVM